MIIPYVGVAPGLAYDSAGYDLYAAEEVPVGPLRMARIPIDLSVSIPAGYYGAILPRSGWSAKGLLVITGTIDPDYRGKVSVLVFNATPDTIKVEAGVRCAQLVVQRYEKVEFMLTSSLDKTERGERGFGSSGY